VRRNIREYWFNARTRRVCQCSATQRCARQCARSKATVRRIQWRVMRIRVVGNCIDVSRWSSAARTDYPLHTADHATCELQQAVDMGKGSVFV
jgi:hypothetical protein